MKKGLMWLLGSAIVISLMMTDSAVAHSGRTDSLGGHRDNKNKSGLGYYHYHCDGNEAHLHPDGICPYAPEEESIEQEQVGDLVDFRGKSILFARIAGLLYRIAELKWS